MFLGSASEQDFSWGRPNPLVIFVSQSSQKFGESLGFLPTQHKDAVENTGQVSSLGEGELDTLPSHRKSQGAVSKMRLAIHQQIRQRLL